jgi:hypothetical protein
VRSGNSRYDEHINLQPHQFGCDIRQPIQLTFRKSPLDDEIASLHVAKFPQALLQGFGGRRTAKCVGEISEPHKLLLRGGSTADQGKSWRCQRDDDHLTPGCDGCIYSGKLVH